MGLFKNEKVGVIDASVDKAEVPIVLSALKAHHIDVVQTTRSIRHPRTTPLHRTNRSKSISQRFQQSGINVVVGIGSGAVGWEQGLSNNPRPGGRLVATQILALHRGGVCEGWRRRDLSEECDHSDGHPFSTGALERSVRAEVRQYHQEGLSINHDRGFRWVPRRTHPTTWVAAENTCQDFAMFVDMAKAAGKHLAAQSFKRGGVRWGT